MATRLQFPRGANHTETLAFINADGSVVDLTGATLTAYIFLQADDIGTPASAIATLSLAAISPSLGTARLIITGALTACLSLNVPYYWSAQATLLDGTKFVSPAHQGTVVLTPSFISCPLPLDEVLSDGSTAVTGSVTSSQQVAVPATSTSTGTIGQWAIDSDYRYDCVATNTWRRTALMDWA